MQVHSSSIETKNHQPSKALSQNILVNANCLDVFKGVPDHSIDMVLTDPPYIVQYESRDGRRIRNDDNERWLMPTFGQLYRVLKQDAFAVCFYGWHKADAFLTAFKRTGFRVAGHLTFIKAYASSVRFFESRHESAYLLVKGNPPMPKHPIPDVMQWQYSGNVLHPTQKPVKPLRQLIRQLSSEGDTVLDPFAGSGSSLVAALVEKRHYFGVEINEKYFAKAVHRLAKAEQILAARANTNEPCALVR